MTAALWILVVAALVGCIAAALHDALRDFSVVRLNEIAERRGHTALVDGVLDDTSGHILAAGTLRVVCFVAVCVSSVVVMRVFEPAAGSVDAAAGLHSINTVRLALAAALAASVTYIFGLVLPASIADHAGERLICGLVVPVRALHLLTWPVRQVALIDLAIKRLTGNQHVTEEQKLEEEIISVVAEGEREGQLGETQRDMIEAVVDFKGRTVDQIMTPRTEIEGFEYTDDLSYIRKFIEAHGHSRTPVYQGDLDHIVGILYAKDLLRFLGSDTTSFKLKPILRRPVWVPETKPLMELLYELRARKVHMAIVADEYGGTAGLVTFEDLLEEIVGEIQDEYEPQHVGAPEIEVKLDQRLAEAEARAYVVDVNEALEPLGVEVPVSEEYDTLGGYVLARLGHIPEPGESFREEGFVVTVLAAEATRVTRLKIERIEPAPDDNPDQRETRAERVEREQDEQSDAEPRVAGA